MAGPAELAYLAYFGTDHVNEALERHGWFPERHLCRTYSQGGTQAYLCNAKTEGVTAGVLMIRGTEPQCPDDLKIDLNAHLARLDGFAGMVHHGFGLEARGLMKWLHSHFESAVRPVRFCVMGHSMGGAIATLVSYRMYRAGFRDLRCFTFGSPRVGNRTFTQAYDQSLHMRHLRTVHNNDLVSRLPLPIFYRHCGVQLYAKRNQRIVYMKPLERFVDHLISRITHLGHFKLDGIADHAMLEYLKIQRLNPGFYPEFDAP